MWAGEAEHSLIWPKHTKEAANKATPWVRNISLRCLRKAKSTNSDGEDN